MNMGNESIPWDKIQKQPDKDHKLRGKDILEFRSAIESQQSELDKRSRTVKQLESEKNSVENALNTERSKAVELERKMASLELDYKNKDAKARLMETEAARKVQELQQKIAELEGREHELKTERDRVKAEKQAKEQELEAMGRQIDAFKRDISDLQGRIVTIEAQKGELDALLFDEKTRLEKQVLDLQEQRDAAVDQYLDLENTIKKPRIKMESEDLATARACMTCKHYVLYKEGDYQYVKAVHLFDAVHRAHMVSTVTFSEVKNGYTAKTQEFIEKTADR
jgi:chromosome segregation ATPase